MNLSSEKDLGLSSTLLDDVRETDTRRSWKAWLSQLRRDWIVTILGPAIMLPISISYCALICKGAKEFFPVVLMQVMWSQFVGSAMFLRSQFRTSCNMDPVASILFVQLAGRIQKEYEHFPDRILPCLIYAMAFASAISGVFLFVLGRFRFGFMLRFLPYTVIGGFLAGIGLLIMLESVSLSAHQEIEVLTYRTATALLPGAVAQEGETDELIANWTQVALTTMYCVVAVYARRVNDFGTVFVLVTAVAAVFVLQSVTGHSQPPKSWFIEIDAFLDWKEPFGQLAHGFLSFNPFDDWYMEFVMSYTFITTVSWCLSIAAIGKVASLREGLLRADEQDEIRNLGVTNILCGVLGGHACCHSFKIPLAMAQVGGGDLWPSLSIAVNFFIFILSPRAVVDQVPRFVFSGIVLNLGLDFVYEWLVQSKKRISTQEWCILLVTAIVTARNITLAIFLGITLSLVLFAIEYSALTGVKRQGTLSHSRSTVDRSPRVCRALEEYGHHFKILWLQGYLFFGSVSHVIDEVRRTVASDDVLAVILDFALVPGMDASGVYAIIDLASELRPKLLLCGLVRRLEKALRNAQAHRGATSNDAILLHRLDDALEWCEEDMLQRLADRGRCARDGSERKKPGIVRVGSQGDVLAISGMTGQEKSLAFKRIWMQLVRKELQRFDRAGTTIPALTKIANARQVPRGAVIYRAGQRAIELIVLSSGSLDVTRPAADDELLSDVHLPRHHLNTQKGDVYVFEEDPPPKRILRARPGAVLGMAEFARKSKKDDDDSGEEPPAYSSSVTAVEDSEIFAIGYSDLTKLEDENLLFAVVLRTFLARLTANALGQSHSHPAQPQPIQFGLVSPVIKSLRDSFDVPSPTSGFTRSVTA